MMHEYEVNYGQLGSFWVSCAIIRRGDYHAHIAYRDPVTGEYVERLVDESKIRRIDSKIST